VFIRAAGIAGVVVLLSACGGPDRSPFVLWWERDQFSKATGGIRTGMPLDSLEHFWPPRSTSSRARSTSSSSRRSRGARGTATASPPAIRDSTSGTLDVTDGSLYVSLHRLEET